MVACAPSTPNFLPRRRSTSSLSSSSLPSSSFAPLRQRCLVVFKLKLQSSLLQSLLFILVGGVYLTEHHSLPDLRDHVHEFLHASMDEHRTCLTTTIKMMFGMSKAVALRSAEPQQAGADSVLPLQTSVSR